MRHSNLWSAIVVAILAPGVAGQTTNNNATNANSNSSSGSASNSTSYGNVGNSTTNYIAPSSGSNANSNATSSTSSNSNASNAGNSQTVIIQAPQPATSGGTAAQRQILSGGTHSSLTTNGTQTVNQNLSGTTTSNQNVSSHISGEQTVRYEYGDQTIKNTPSVGGPPLTTSNDTCMGSSSGSVNVPGFGVGLGSTWTDRNCVMLKNAREMWNMGMKAAALALFCTDDNNRMALEITGFICPQTQLARQQAAAAEAARVASAQEQARRDEQRRALRFGRGEPAVPPGLPLELMPPLQATASLARPEPAAPAPEAPPAETAAPQPQAQEEPPQARATPVREAVATPIREAMATPTAADAVQAEPAQAEPPAAETPQAAPAPAADEAAAPGAVLVRVVSEPAR